MDVTYPGFGSIQIEGVRFDHDVIVEAGVVRRRRKGPSRPYRGRFGHTPLSIGEDIPWSAPHLVIGTGASGRLPVMDEVVAEAARRGVAMTVVPTAEACALLRSGAAPEANAILHVTC